MEAAARLFQLVDIADDDDPLSEEGSTPEINGKVVFKNCEFAYPTREAIEMGSRLILLHVNLLHSLGAYTFLYQETMFCWVASNLS